MIKKLWECGIDKVLAEWIADMVVHKKWFNIAISMIATMGIMSFLYTMPVWYQVITCIAVLVFLGRVAWLAGKINAKKS